jgi:hypothetical protein
MRPLMLHNRKEKKQFEVQNYTEIEFLHLVKTWEAVLLNAVARSDQTDKKYW